MGDCGDAGGGVYEETLGVGKSRERLADLVCWNSFPGSFRKLSEDVKVIPRLNLGVYLSRGMPISRDAARGPCTLTDLN